MTFDAVLREHRIGTRSRKRRSSVRIEMPCDWWRRPVSKSMLSTIPGEAFPASIGSAYWSNAASDHDRVASRAAAREGPRSALSRLVRTLIRPPRGCECAFSPGFFIARTVEPRSTAGSLESAIRKDHANRHGRHGDSKDQGGDHEGLHRELPCAHAIATRRATPDLYRGRVLFARVEVQLGVSCFSSVQTSMTGL